MPRALRVGVQLPEVEREVRWPEYVAMARAAEEAGFDSIWIGDHILYRGDGRPERGPWDAWTLLAGLAVVTERVRLGPLVACLAFHHPGVLARKAAAVDELSGGRLVLGVGAGWNEAEFRAFGLPFDHRFARFDEAFRIIRRLLDGERVTMHGRYHALAEAVVLPRPTRRIPVMVGSTGERVLRAALPSVDIWNTWFDGYGNTPDGFERTNAEITRIAGEIGRDPNAIERSVCVLVALDRVAPERVLEDVPPVEGGPKRIADALRSLASAGANEAILVVTPMTERSIRSLGEVVAELRRERAKEPNSNGRLVGRPHVV